jgi:hypothetical protein
MRLEGSLCLHLQGQVVKEYWTVLLWTWKPYASPKRRLSTVRHGVTLEVAWIFMWKFAVMPVNEKLPSEEFGTCNTYSARSVYVEVIQYLFRGDISVTTINSIVVVWVRKSLWCHLIHYAIAHRERQIDAPSVSHVRNRFVTSVGCNISAVELGYNDRFVTWVGCNISAVKLGYNGRFVTSVGCNIRVVELGYKIVKGTEYFVSL